MPTVLVYRSHLLPYSETFIREQILAYRRWQAVLTGRKLLHQLPLDGLALHYMGANGTDLLARAHAKLQWTLGAPPGLDALRGRDIRLLHVHFGPDAVEAAPIARRLRLPMAVTLHGYDITIHRDWWEAGHGGEERRRYPERLLALSREPHVRFIAVSDHIRNEAIRFGIAPEKVTTRYIGIDPAKFRPGSVPLAARDRRVLFVGRLVEKKGCEYLLRAMRFVRARIPDAELTIVGDGPLRERLEALSGELGIGAEFLGSLPSEAVRRQFDKARVFCLPSVRAENGDAEGLPISILEAQASGVPVVTSALGGRSEGIEDGQTGFAFEEADVSALADKLLRLLGEDRLATEFSESARRFVQTRFNIRTCTAKLEELYASIKSMSEERHG